MYKTITDFNRKITLWLIVVSAISVTLPTAFMSITSALLIIFWLISGNFEDKFERIKSNPGAVIAIVLFGMYIIGCFYSSAPSKDSFNFLMKYLKLLLIPIIISVLVDDNYRKYALNAFLIGMLITLFLSYLKWLRIIPFDDIGQGYIVFKGRIAQNIMMSFAAFMMLEKALTKKNSQQIGWVILSILSIINILFLVNGRTGQVTLLVLLALFGLTHWKRKTVYILSVATTLFGICLITNHAPHSRLTDINTEVKQGTSSSAGQRMEMYSTTLKTIQNHILFGGGTGSLENEYAVIAKQKQSNLIRVPNPHNQYLLTFQELGLFGLIAILYLWAAHFNLAYYLSQNNKVLLQALVICICIGASFNSLLLDASEGKFYCILSSILLSQYNSKAHKIKGLRKLSVC